MDQSWNKRPESIADHMYRMALMALIVGDVPDVNRERLVFHIPYLEFNCVFT